MVALELLFLWTSTLLKTACFMLNSTASKNPQKRTNNPSLLWIQEFNKTQIIYLQCLRFLAQLFRKLEWPLLYTLDCQLRLAFLWGDVVHCSVTTPTFDKRLIYAELHVSIDLIFKPFTGYHPWERETLRNCVIDRTIQACMQFAHWLPSLRTGNPVI